MTPKSKNELQLSFKFIALRKQKKKIFNDSIDFQVCLQKFLSRATMKLKNKRTICNYIFFSKYFSTIHIKIFVYYITSRDTLNNIL